MKGKPEDIFRIHGGQLHVSEAIKHDISRYMLFSLSDKGGESKLAPPSRADQIS